MKSTNNDFSITFWIRVAKNPGWRSDESQIDFPLLKVDDFQIYYSKFKKELRVFILHPELGHRKLSANIKDYIGRDTFIAVTGDSEATSLYINGELASTISNSETLKSLAAGDYIMIRARETDKDKPLPAQVRKDPGEGKITVALLHDSLDTHEPAAIRFEHSRLRGVVRHRRLLTKYYEFETKLLVSLLLLPVLVFMTQCSQRSGLGWDWLAISLVTFAALAGSVWSHLITLFSIGRRVDVAKIVTSGTDDTARMNRQQLHKSRS